MIKLPEIIKQYLDTIESADTKKVTYWIVGILLGILMINCLYIGRYIRVASHLKRTLRLLNEQREEARLLREKMLQVHNQRESVDQMLEQEKDFKIGGYIANILQKLKLADKKRIAEPTQTEIQESYRETEITLSLVEMNMQELVELLHEIEQKKRIYIKRLEIERSKKQPSHIDVLLSIATLISL